MSIKLGIHGVSGRMGKEVVKLASQDPALASLYGFSKKNSGASSFTLASSSQELLNHSDVVIDFSTDEALLSLLKKTNDKTPLVIGTTGLSPETEDLIERLSYRLPIVYAANFSLGVAACMQAAEMLSAKLSKEFSINICETHHIHKKDSPSGTAIAFAKVMGTQDPIQSIRTGEVIGKHQIIFSNAQEKIELSHEALTRNTFAFGALFAAKALVLKPAGLYSLKDLLD